MSWQVTSLVPLAQVADVDRSIAFYQKLGLALGGRTKDGNIDFAGLRAERGATVLMLTRGRKPVAGDDQRIVFYLYTRDLKALRERLVAEGIAVSPIVPREYMERGEVELTDPDGYTVFIGEDG
ncbi:MAG: VOC family protein [Candidatus Koribacter versatilis]|uniref:VOC family protein n=1 Tax=Candidatus Korobacter versatilis TaxID=658062 RepID=A0A932A7U9_9BACT|nr:VOC family protein [Candidatus Koribacter versatilis]